MEVLIDGAFVSSIVAGGTILAGFLTRPHPTFKVLTYCFICSLIVVIVDFYNLSGCLVELNAESVIRLHCPFQNCGKFYKNKKNLNEHH